MKILITGAKGFIGKNLVATLATDNTYTIYEYDIENTKEDLKKFTQVCDFVVHLAGVNRPQDPKEFNEGNAGFTETLCKYLKDANNKCPILVSSSVQAELENDYGKSKREGEQIILTYGKQENVEVYIYRFANLFGKWCRPNYNSVIATWCHAIANNQSIQIDDSKKELVVCYIDDVIAEIIEAIHGNSNKNDIYCKVMKEYATNLGTIASLIRSFKLSRSSLQIPNMKDELTKKLYSTYLSYLPITDFSYELNEHSDKRGSFTELLKMDSFGQVSVNISKPGIAKGNHWHHSKNEKFIVVSGKALIQFRDIFSEEIIEYVVSDEKLKVVDIPTGYTHNIMNIGETDLVTIMWANEEFDPNHPDTYYEQV